MASRTGFVTIGLIAVTGLGYLAWHDPQSLLPQWFDQLRRMADVAPTAERAVERPAKPLVSAVDHRAMAPSNQPLTVPRQPQKRLPSLTNPLAGLERDAFNAVVSRPLFSPSRRPPQPKRVVVRSRPVPLPVRPLKPAPKRPEMMFEIVGTITNRSRKLAILKDQRTGRHISAATNAKIKGWRVADIQPTSVLLKQGRWEVRLSIFSPP